MNLRGFELYSASLSVGFLALTENISLMNEVELKLQPLHELFEVSSHDVFESLGCKVVRVEKADEKVGTPCAYISAHSDELEMLMLLRGPLTVLEQTLPAKGAGKSVTESDLNDWLSELANRFMGNLKNKLLVYGHRLSLGTPKSESNVGPNHFVVDDFTSFVLYFDTGCDVFECALYTKPLTENLHFIYHEPAHYAQKNDDGDLEMF